VKPRRPDLDHPLETERFRLQPLGRWAAFRLSYPWTRDPELMRSFTQNSGRRSARRWYREMSRPNGRNRFSFGIVPKETGEFIGMHTVLLDGYRSAILSVMIHDRAWWGRQVVHEVRGQLIEHFIAHGPVERFWSFVEARNMASVFNYRTLGFTHVGTLRRLKRDPVTGEVFDFLIFELMSADWRKDG
jgi:RimJ/RimL family protein N-acetyltransferase